jgi:hypothetical protein
VRSSRPRWKMTATLPRCMMCCKVLKRSCLAQLGRGGHWIRLVDGSWAVPGYVKTMAPLFSPLPSTNLELRITKAPKSVRSVHG